MRKQSLNSQSSVQAVLEWLKQVLQEHCPTQHEADVWIESSADVGVGRSSGRIHRGEATKTDGGSGHRHHGGKKSRYGVTLREHLCLTEHRNGSDGRNQDDAVVDQVPKTQNSFQSWRCL